MKNRWADAAKAVRPLFFSLVLLLFAAGCKTTDDFVGSGSLTLTPHITNYYRDQYLKSPGPHYFVVSRHSRWAGYTACSNGLSGCSGEGVIFSVLSRCEERAGEPCYILDKWGSVVWKGPVTFADGTTVGTPAPESDKAVCNLALRYRGNEPAWDTEKYGAHVREVQKRGHTVESCFRLVFGDGNQPAAAASPEHLSLCRKTVNYRPVRPAWSASTYLRTVEKAQALGLTPEGCARLVLDRMADQEICHQAATYRGESLEWAGRAYGAVIREARTRGLSLARCEEVMFGKPAGPTAATVDVDAATAAAAALADLPLCQRAIAITSRGMIWDRSSSGRAYVEEAKSRGLSDLSCASRWVKSMSTSDLCQRALLHRKGQPEWIGGAYNRFAWELESRGVTPKSCDQLLAG